MSNERLYFCIALSVTGLVLLGAATVLLNVSGGAQAAASGAGGAHAALPQRPPMPNTASAAGTSPRLLAWPVGVLGVGLLGAAFVIMLRAGAVTSAGSRRGRICARCGRNLERELHETLACSGCGAPTRCPQCAADLTRGAADTCARCGAPWGCRRCGYSLKGLASNSCPSCQAPMVCRCGAELTHNISGRCTRCGARIAGWREWK